MSLEAAFYHHCKDNAGVAALVAERIYITGEAPSSLTAAQSYITYQRLPTSRVRHQGGVSGLAQASWQVNCYAASPSSAKALADAVRAAWETQSGATGEAGNTVTVKVASIESTFADYVQPSDGSQGGEHRYVLDMTIWYAEP